MPKKTTKPLAIAKVEKMPIAPAQLTPEALISQGIQNNLSVETLERLLDMRREAKAEWAKEQYDSAMAAFQAECPTIRKTKSVKTKSGQEAYRYAPIESIVGQVKELLQKHGFSYATKMELVDGGVKVVVFVKHLAGHAEESPMHVPFGNKTDIMSQSQVVAAAQTFAKRYAFCNAFGILTGDEDNDADLSKTALRTDPTQGNDSKYDTAVKMIKACRSIDPLIEYAEKLKQSKNFTPAQVKALNTLCSKRVDEVNNK
jgi:hypothetical protein